jgi:hypothetical protein
MAKPTRAKRVEAAMWVRMAKKRNVLECAAG